MQNKIEIQIHPMSTMPPSPQRVATCLHEGSIIVIIGTNGKAAGWFDANKDIAPHFYRDRFYAPVTP